METLTKENFWNRIKDLYPEAFKVFGQWVNNYKIDNEWVVLFNEGFINFGKEINLQNDLVQHIPTSKAPKYHDLPVALQWGIFTQFVYETLKIIPNNGENRITLHCGSYIGEVKIVIEDFFKWLQEQTNG